MPTPGTVRAPVEGRSLAEPRGRGLVRCELRAEFGRQLLIARLRGDVQRPSRPHERVGGSSRLSMDPAEKLEDLRVLTIRDGDRLPGVRNSLLRSACFGQRHGQPHPRREALRAALDGFAQERNGLAEPATHGQQRAKARLRLRVVWAQRQGLLELSVRIIRLADLGQGRRQVVVRIGVVRAHVNRGAELRDRLRNVSPRDECAAIVVVDCRVTAATPPMAMTSTEMTTEMTLARLRRIDRRGILAPGPGCAPAARRHVAAGKERGESP